MLLSAMHYCMLMIYVATYLSCVGHEDFLSLDCLQLWYSPVQFNCDHHKYDHV